jgi:hypothetical protein
MPDQVAALRSIGPLRPGASDDVIRETEEELECRLPPELLSIYGQHDGQSRSVRYGLRLMPLAELRRAWTDLRSLELQCDAMLRSVRPIWADDEGHYAAIHVDDPLTGYVCILDYHDLDTSPLYSSTQSFLRDLEEVHAAQGDWWDLRPEYPRVEPSSCDPTDLAAAEVLLLRRDVVAEPRLSRQLGLSALRILPAGNNDTIRNFMRSGDLWLRERACAVAGVQQIEVLVPELLDIARCGKGPNDRIAALLALQKIPGDEASTAVTLLRGSLGPEWHGYFRERPDGGRGPVQ